MAERQATAEEHGPVRPAAAEPDPAALRSLGEAFVARARAAGVEPETRYAFGGAPGERRAAYVKCWTIWPAGRPHPDTPRMHGLYVLADGKVIFGSAEGAAYEAPLPRALWPVVMDALAGFLASRGA